MLKRYLISLQSCVYSYKIVAIRGFCEIRVNSFKAILADKVIQHFQSGHHACSASRPPRGLSSWSLNVRAWAQIGFVALISFLFNLIQAVELSLKMPLWYVEHL